MTKTEEAIKNVSQKFQQERTLAWWNNPKNKELYEFERRKLAETLK